MVNEKEYSGEVFLVPAREGGYAGLLIASSSQFSTAGVDSWLAGTRKNGAGVFFIWGVSDPWTEIYDNASHDPYIKNLKDSWFSSSRSSSVMFAMRAALALFFQLIRATARVTSPIPTTVQARPLLKPVG